jgi:predicted nucleotidyltransferase
MTEADIQPILDRIVRKIAENAMTEKIILFGSWAKGAATDDSDLDLLIVMNVRDSKRQEAIKIDLLLEGIPLPTDVIVVTPQDIEKYRNCPGTIIRQAVQEGRVLYERAA